MRALLVLLMLWVAPAQACRLGLVIALDVSSSVDAREYRLQLDGLAYALEHPRVTQQLFAFPEAPVALHVFEWSGRFNQVTLLPWIVIEDRATLAQVTASLRQTRRTIPQRPTALGHALGHAIRKTATSPSCARHTIDVSGDGFNNDGITPQRLYAMTPTDGITINGLPIGDGDVANYYFRTIIRGHGAFVEWARDFDDFARAMRDKLERELRPAALSALRP